MGMLRSILTGLTRWLMEVEMISNFLGAAALATMAIGSANPEPNSSPADTTVILVHGGFVDGSGWAGVYQRLTGNGFNVLVVQNPTTSLAEDVAVTRRAIAASKGQVILVGHSYGGVVITEAGNDPKVAGLVYVAAFMPDRGESVSSLIANPPPGAAVPPILPPVDGFLFLDRTKFPAAFAADPHESAIWLTFWGEAASIRLAASRRKISTPFAGVRPVFSL